MLAILPGKAALRPLLLFVFSSEGVLLGFQSIPFPL